MLCLCLVGILFILCSNFHWMSFKVTIVVLRCIFYINICGTKYTIQIFLPVAPLYCIQKRVTLLVWLALKQRSSLQAQAYAQSLFYPRCVQFLFIYSRLWFIGVISLQTLLTPQYCKLVAIIFIRDQRYKCQDSATAYVPVVCR